MVAQTSQKTHNITNRVKYKENLVYFSCSMYYFLESCLMSLLFDAWLRRTTPLRWKTFQQWIATDYKFNIHCYFSPCSKRLRIIYRKILTDFSHSLSQYSSFSKSQTLKLIQILSNWSGGLRLFNHQIYLLHMLTIERTGVYWFYQNVCNTQEEDSETSQSVYIFDSICLSLCLSAQLCSICVKHSFARKNKDIDITKYIYPWQYLSVLLSVCPTVQYVW